MEAQKKYKRIDPPSRARLDVIAAAEPYELKPEDYDWTGNKAIAMLAAMARNYAVDDQVRHEAKQMILLLTGAIDRYTDSSGREWITVARHNLLHS